MRRNTKTMYEWRKAYRDKEELMLERGFPEVSPHEFYPGREKGEKNRPFLRGQKGKIKYIDNISPL